MRLQGKTALIASGTCGIGLVTTECFLRERTRVAITGRGASKRAQALVTLSIAEARIDELVAVNAKGLFFSVGNHPRAS